MSLNATMQKLHKRAPRLGKALSLATATSVIAANSFGGSIPLWLMGMGKIITGAPIADKTVIKITNHWISSNNALIETYYHAKIGELLSLMTCMCMANTCWSATINLGLIPVSCSTSAKNVYL